MNDIETRRSHTQEAMEWARDVLQDNRAIILDSETSDMHGEIIELAIIDLQGNPVMNQRIRPQGGVNEGATRIHGITVEHLANAPTFDIVYPVIKSIVENRNVLIYNARYDIGRLLADCRRNNLPAFDISSDCVMEWYAQWYGEWNDYHGNYKWQPLNGDHSAMGDCIATLKLLHVMAGTNETQSLD